LKSAQDWNQFELLVRKSYFDTSIYSFRYLMDPLFLYFHRMESRLIYEKSRHLKSLVCWEEVSDSEWIYCGAKGEVKYDLIGKHINDFFSEGKAYVSLTRKDSFEIERKFLLESITELIGDKNFLIWDEIFNKSIEFYHIGVFRKGSLSPNK
jgi:hypothetical protein